VSRILNFLLPFVITIFCGHIGNSELAGYALASAVFTPYCLVVFLFCVVVVFVEQAPVGLVHSYYY